jgi:hypothetical protein
MNAQMHHNFGLYRLSFLQIYFKLFVTMYLFYMCLCVYVMRPTQGSIFVRFKMLLFCQNGMCKQNHSYYNLYSIIILLLIPLLGCAKNNNTHGNKKFKFNSIRGARMF